MFCDRFAIQLYDCQIPVESVLSLFENRPRSP